MLKVYIASGILHFAGHDGLLAENHGGDRAYAGGNRRYLLNHGLHFGKIHIAAVLAGIVRIGIDAHVDYYLPRLYEIALDHLGFSHGGDKYICALANFRQILGPGMADRHGAVLS